jgi:hypothetical protein
MRGVLAICLLSGCLGQVNEDNYAQKYSGEYCQKTRHCNLGLFESEWSDMNDCLEDVDDDIEDLIDDMDDADCDFDDDDAQECLETFVAADCEDYHEGDAFEDCGVNKVWDCD